MEEYKRVTNPQWKEHYDVFENCYDCETDCGACELNYMALKRLAELEDKIENGMLIEFLCKVGETCYIIMGDKKIKEAVVINFSIEAGGIYAKVRFKEGIFLYTSITELNKTYEQAEAKLKELQVKE